MLEHWKLGTRLRGLSGLSRRSLSSAIDLATVVNEGGSEASAKNNAMLGSGEMG